MERPRIGIVDCRSGNLRSVSKAVAHEGGEPEILSGVDEDWSGLILPGVGAFGHVMRNIEPIRRELVDYIESGKPYLGICLGLQILFESSEEDPEPGLGIFKGRVTRVEARKVPHIGWNSLDILRDSRILAGVRPGEYFYFVHSYAARPADDEVLVATCNYDGDVLASVVERQNVAACQFHPEKSGRAGLRVIRNFVEISRGMTR